MGLVPIPEFWSETSHRRTPARALLLHWIFSVVCIVVTPLDGPNGFLVMSTFYSYIHTWFSSTSVTWLLVLTLCTLTWSRSLDWL